MGTESVVMNNRPVIETRYSDAAISVDDFDHQEWNHAQSIEIARLWSGEQAPHSRHAEARILWSPGSLLVRFVCNQTEPLVISTVPQLEQKTIGLWERDVCEIFLAPNPNQPNHYFEFEAAPTGEWVDLAIHLKPSGRETDYKFRSGMTTAAHLAADRLMISIRIPWSYRIPKPQKGDEWRVNLFRCIGFGNERYLAWQPTHAPEPLFHVPEAFGWLSFI
jgi:hypothetical protein